MLAAKTGAKAKTVMKEFRKTTVRPTAADSIHEIGNGSITLMNCSSGLSKQKHRSVHACCSRAGHTILFHLSVYSLLSDLVGSCFSRCCSRRHCFQMISNRSKQSSKLMLIFFANEMSDSGSCRQLQAAAGSCRHPAAGSCSRQLQQAGHMLQTFIFIDLLCCRAVALLR